MYGEIMAVWSRRKDFINLESLPLPRQNGGSFTVVQIGCIMHAKLHVYSYTAGLRRYDIHTVNFQM